MREGQLLAEQPPAAMIASYRMNVSNACSKTCCTNTLDLQDNVRGAEREFHFICLCSSGFFPRHILMANERFLKLC